MRQACVLRPGASPSRLLCTHRANLEEPKEVELHALRIGHCDSACNLTVQFYAEMRMKSHVTVLIFHPRDILRIRLSHNCSDS